MQAPPLWKGVSADKTLSHDNPVQQLVRRTIEEEIVDTSTRVKWVDVLGVSGISALLALFFFWKVPL